MLVPIIAHGGEDCILLTKRPATLPQYPGQVSFPGGARDPSDQDLAATALREAFEEVGIEPGRISLVAELPWQSTALGHRVKPFLARVAPGPLRPNGAEVERLLFLPVKLLRTDPFRVRGLWTDSHGRTRTIYTLQFEGCEVWGLTARILREEFVEGDGRGTAGDPA